MNIILWIALGITSGWIADIVTESEHGVLEDIIFGVVGAIVAGFFMNIFGTSAITGFNLYSLAAASFGAIFLIILGRIINKEGRRIAV